jgi:hypothetical protein
MWAAVTWPMLTSNAHKPTLQAGPCLQHIMRLKCLPAKLDVYKQRKLKLLWWWKQNIVLADRGTVKGLAPLQAPAVPSC